MATDDAPPESDRDSNPFAPTERKIAIAAIIIFTANIICLLLLAARSESSPETRSFFDVAIVACALGVATYGFARFMFLFPFRLLDLLVMIITLSFGMKSAIEFARWIESERFDVSGWALYAVVCMIVGCALMGGAAMGLRNCRLLNVQTPFKRTIVIVLGMLTLPAPICLVVTPFHLIHALMTARQTPSDTIVWVVAMIFSAGITAANSTLSLRAMSLTTEN